MAARRRITPRQPDKLFWYGDDKTTDVLLAVVDGLGQPAEDVKFEARRRAPVDTGWLRSNIDTVAATRESGMVVAGVGVDLATVPYAAKQEDRVRYLEKALEEVDVVGQVAVIVGKALED